MPVVIVIEHTPEWRVTVGPFDSYRYAMEWLRVRSTLLAEAKTEILELQKP